MYNSSVSDLQFLSFSFKSSERLDEWLEQEGVSSETLRLRERCISISIAVLFCNYVH